MAVRIILIACLYTNYCTLFIAHLSRGIYPFYLNFLSFDSIYKICGI